MSAGFASKEDMAEKKIHPFTVRQEMLTHNYEIFRYRDSYLKHVELHQPRITQEHGLIK